MTQAANRTFYEVLGVGEKATTDEIKKSFKKLARTHHPDAGGDEAVFKEISEAYEVLSDEAKRKEYDNLLRYGAFTAAGGAAAGGMPFNWGGRGGSWTVTDMGGGGGGGFGSIGDLFSRMAAGEGACGTDWEFGGKKKKAHKGKDIQVTLEVTFEEAFKGTEKRVTVKSSDGGNQTIDVKVPEGAVEGGKLRYKGKGTAGNNGGPAGDLLIVTSLKPHELYARSGADVLMELPLALDEAALGATIEVPAPDGSTVNLKVPAGTQEGKVFLVKGKGAKRVGGKPASSEYGDLKVRATLVVPQELNEAQKAALAAFAAAGNAEVRKGWEQ
jgi:curved DNA-binding protein